MFSVFSQKDVKNGDYGKAMDSLHKQNFKVSPILSIKVVEAAKLSLPPRNKILNDVEREIKITVTVHASI